MRIQLRFLFGPMLAMTIGIASYWLAVTPAAFANESDPTSTATTASSVEPMTEEETEFFENQVRPLLAEHCFKCHSSEKTSGGLRVDSLSALLAGGEAGPAIVPSDPEESILLRALNYDGYEMPPNGKLPAEQIGVIKRWVEDGARWPGNQGEAIVSVRKSFEITAEDRQYWAFQPIRRPSAGRQALLETISASPAVSSVAKHPIDELVDAKLNAMGVVPNPRANARVQIRRAYFDLIGLPPTPEEMSLWQSRLEKEADTGYEALLDHLLSLPEYGERWGRHWLDVVRYAESNGYERDGEKPLAWKYRDYVIQAFNQDKPYDRFVMEQLAGDELPDATEDSFTATGFFHLGVHDDEPDDSRQAQFDELDDMLVATGAAFMGLTVGCARCHSHKFDPIAHEDYYRLLSCFRNVRSYSAPDNRLDSAATLPIGDLVAFRESVAQRDQKLVSLQSQIDAIKGDAEDEKKTREQLTEAKHQAELIHHADWAMAVRENGGEPPETRVLIRGNPATESDLVQPDALQVFDHLLSLRSPFRQNDAPSTPHSTSPSKQEPSAASAEHPAAADLSPFARLRTEYFPTSGRRLKLARWIANKENPMTARVMANRIWHYHFGKGIVKTTSDFGRAGVPPTNLELLDWLAAEFMDNGWSVKRLHKSIMLSETYRRSSDTNNAQGLGKDPTNDYHWRQNLRRLEAEAIRDSVLSINGSLNSRKGGPSFYPRLAGEMLAGGSRPGDGWKLSSEDDRQRRSVYSFVKRSIMAPLMESFDYANTTSPMGERPLTTVAPQALMLLNDPFMQEQSQRFANRLVQQSGDNEEKIVDLAFRLALQRPPTPYELGAALEYWRRQVNEFVRSQNRISFRPNVPVSLHSGYRSQLQGSDYLIGPVSGWNYSRGVWGSGYESIEKLDVDRAPSAIWRGAVFTNASLETSIQFNASLEKAGLLLRATMEADQARGYEIAFIPHENLVHLRRLQPVITTLATVKEELAIDHPISIRVELADERVKVWFSGNQAPVDQTKPPQIDVIDANPIVSPGGFGISTWGSSLTLIDPVLHLPQRSVDIARSQVSDQMVEGIAIDGMQQDASKQRALEQLCLMILNLNEVVYIE